LHLPGQERVQMWCYCWRGSCYLFTFGSVVFWFTKSFCEGSKALSYGHWISKVSEGLMIQLLFLISAYVIILSLYYLYLHRTSKKHVVGYSTYTPLSC